jgi:hypothetical protein
MDFVIGLLVFASVWIFMNYIVSYFSGWRDLVKHYSTQSKGKGKKFLFRSGFGHWWCLVFFVDRSALHIRVLFPFNIGSPPVLIPLDEVEIHSRSSIGLRGQKITFKKISRTYDLPKDVVDAISANRSA